MITNSIGADVARALARMDEPTKERRCHRSTTAVSVMATKAAAIPGRMQQESQGAPSLGDRVLTLQK